MNLTVGENHSLSIPASCGRSALDLPYSKIKEGERRLVEARVVNGATYSDLEYTYNEGYRQARSNLSSVGYEIAQTKRVIRKIRSEYLLDEYPPFLKEKKLKDNAQNREAYLDSQEDYVAATDRLDMLVAIESLLEGKVKVFENVCRYMKKEIEIQLRSGMTDNKYIGR